MKMRQTNPMADWVNPGSSFANPTKGFANPKVTSINPVKDFANQKSTSVNPKSYFINPLAANANLETTFASRSFDLGLARVRRGLAIKRFSRPEARLTWQQFDRQAVDELFGSVIPIPVKIGDHQFAIVPQVERTKCAVR